MPSFKVLVNNEHGAHMCVGIIFSEEDENGIISDFLDNDRGWWAVTEPQHFPSEPDIEGIEGVEESDTGFGPRKFTAKRTARTTRRRVSRAEV
jgi:hypothetical protein